MSHADIDALFKLDFSDAKAYDGCKIESYELTDGTSALTDTSKVEYASADGNGLKQGLNWKLDNAVANYQSAVVKVTTIG